MRMPPARHLLIAVIPLLGSACSSHPPPVATPYSQLHGSPHTEIPESAAIRQLLLSHYSGWSGVPYRFGGNSKKGIDCSAYTLRVYKEIFDLPLKRRVVDQRRQGTKIEPSDIRAGDLVFFNPNTYPHHVGVALGDGRFVHVSSKKGVMISSLHTGYWAKYFREARRIIDYVERTSSAKPSPREG